MTEPLFSAVIQCFNGADVVSDAIQRALDQGPRPAEVTFSPPSDRNSVSVARSETT